MNTKVKSLEHDVSNTKVAKIACALGCAAVKLHAMDNPFALFERAPGLF
jgi:hypothetical protein